MGAFGFKAGVVRGVDIDGVAVDGENDGMVFGNMDGADHFSIVGAGQGKAMAKVGPEGLDFKGRDIVLSDIGDEPRGEMSAPFGEGIGDGAIEEPGDRFGGAWGMGVDDAEKEGADGAWEGDG